MKRPILRSVSIQHLKIDIMALINACIVRRCKSQALILLGLICYGERLLGN